MSSENMFKSLENFLFQDNEPDYGELYSSNKMFRGVVNSSLDDISIKDKNKDLKKKIEFTGPFYEIKDNLKIGLAENLIFLGVYENIEELEKDQKILDLNKDTVVKKKKRVYIKYSNKMKKKRELKKKIEKKEREKKIELEKKNKIKISKKGKINRQQILNYIIKEKKNSIKEPKKKVKMQIESSSNQLTTTIKKKNLFNYFQKK